MGISRGTVKLIASTLGQKTGGIDRGMAITFGVQKLDCSKRELCAQLHMAGPALAFAAEESDKEQPAHQNDLFGWLGFSRVDSIDYYPDEKPSFLLDLNNPIPADMAGRYGLVYDGGTMEHCFDPPQVMRNAAMLAEVGGTVIHHVPMNNWVDHGFYQFSPTLFFDFYSACGFEDLTMTLHFQEKRKESHLLYDPRHDMPIPYGAMAHARCLIFFSARKTGKSDPLLTARPIQGRYRATFGDQKSSVKRKRTFTQRIRTSLRKRFFGWLAKPL